MKFHQEIQDFVTRAGVACRELEVDGLTFLEATHAAGKTLYILPAEIIAGTPEEAAEEQVRRHAARKHLTDMCRTGAIGREGREAEDIHTVTLAEDRWKSQPRLYQARLLSHLGQFHSIFARNCEAERIDKSVAGRFLDKNHNYGSSVCRYSYGLTERKSGRLVAAATFSNARKWNKDGKEIRSYEWIRYASECGTRIPGGMGKILKKFMEDIRPDDIMSYADLEWSDGAVYRRLGFREDGSKDPVLFAIDPVSWTRTVFRDERQFRPSDSNAPVIGGNYTGMDENMLWYMNDGSLKYRYRL